MSLNYQPIVVGNQPNDNAGIKENLDAGKVGKKTVSAQHYVLLPFWSSDSQDPKNTDDDVVDDAFEVKENVNDVLVSANEKFSFNSTNRVNVVSEPINAAGPNATNNTNNFNTASPSVSAVTPNFRIARQSSFVDPSKYHDDPDMPELEDIVYLNDEEDNSRKYSKHSTIQVRLKPCKKSFYNLNCKRLGNKARLVAHGHTQEEGIDYDEVFASVARIEAIRLFLAYASFMGFMVYKMDVKSSFFYGNIEEEVYVCQPPGFEDPAYPDKVYKVVKTLYGLHQTPRS
nr:copia protein [Tanacetum cinerariifolium]